MALYLPYRLRAFNAIGFSGFEGRHYSVFPTFGEDLGRAVDLQNLLNALAFKYIAEGTVDHADIPDQPTIESERRQIFFIAAIGIRSFNIAADSPNLFLRKLLRATACTRHSRRYSGALRVHTPDYLNALLTTLKNDGAGLIEAMGLQSTVEDLEQRLSDPDANSALGRLLKGILEEAGARSPFDVPADSFNRSAEKYFRETLRKRHLREAIEVFSEECRQHGNPMRHDCASSFLEPATKIQQLIEALQRSGDPEALPAEQLLGLIRLALALVVLKKREAQGEDVGNESRNSA
jgi:hypothetical protein